MKSYEPVGGKKPVITSFPWSSQIVRRQGPLRVLPGFFGSSQFRLDFPPVIEPRRQPYQDARKTLLEATQGSRDGVPSGLEFLVLQLLLNHFFGDRFLILALHFPVSKVNVGRTGFVILPGEGQVSCSPHQAYQACEEYHQRDERYEVQVDLP